MLYCQSTVLLMGKFVRFEAYYNMCNKANDLHFVSSPRDNLGS
jgi:hypothetical protein